MIRIAVLGASGRMGQLVSQLVCEHPGTVLAAAVDAPDAPTIGRVLGDTPVVPLRDAVLRECDVVIDFSTPDALMDALPHLGDAALVTGTTGLTDDQQRQLQSACLQRPWIQAANFSAGVNVLLDLVERASGLLADYDIEVVEAHHRHKVDAPSGTALALGHAAAAGRGQSLDALAIHGRAGRTGARPSGEIGFHALRGGDVAGDHTVWIAGDGERIELRHVASSRATFAQGAVRAAIWLSEQDPGRYHMRDVLGLD